MGLDECFDVTTADPAVFKYYANGYRRCKYPERFELCIGIVAWCPVEKMVVELLADDRLLLRFCELLGEMDRLATSAATLPTSLFDEIARVALFPIDGSDLKSETLRSMHISMAYCYMESFLFRVGLSPIQPDSGRHC